MALRATCLFLGLRAVLAATRAHVEQVSVEKFRTGTPEQQEEQVLLLRKAFQNQGMVVLIDHGVPQAVIQDVMAESKKFFALPRKRKMQFVEATGYPPRSYAAIANPTGRGYSVQQEDDEGNVLNEWLLTRNSSLVVDRGDAYYASEEGREFYSTEQQHPEQQLWPEEVPGLRKATEAYYTQVERLANTMYELFALAAGLPRDFFTSRAKKAAIWPVTIAHYPAQVKEPPEGKMGIQPHWDRTLFALITSSDTGEDPEAGGTQILVDSETGQCVDGRASMEGRSVEWRDVVKPPGSFAVNVGEMMSRWSNGRLKHVVHRVPNPKPNKAGHEGRMAIMAYVLPDYDAVVECELCKADGAEALYEKTWVGEMMNWGSKLPIYNQTRQELMRMAQGLYTKVGAQTKLGDPTDVNAIAAELAANGREITVIDVSALAAENSTLEEQLPVAKALSDSFATTGFAVITGHGMDEAAARNLRSAAYDFFHLPAEGKALFDKGKGYGFGGYVNRRENGAQLLGDFSRPNDIVESLTVSFADHKGGVEAVIVGREASDSDTCSASNIRACQIEAGAPDPLKAPAADFLHAAAVLNRIAQRALQLALNVSRTELVEVLDTVTGGIRLAYYPVSEVAPGQMRYGTHIDSGGITVVSLDPDSSAGLQVDVGPGGTRAGNEEVRQWVDVPFVPNSFVFNVGALLSRWTGGRWRASVHRVMTTDTERLSIITGVVSPRIDGPSYAGFPSCLAGTASAEQPPVKASEYLATRVALHRPEYKFEQGLATDEDVAAEASRIRKLDV